MASLNISEFSCLKQAHFELAPVNVIIGPQGSGKSVTTKLFYFFTDIMHGCLQSAERGDSFEEYKRLLAKQFSLWFPPSAWGQGRFNIAYSAGAFTVRALRRLSGGRVSNEVVITPSEWFRDFYRQASDQFENANHNNTVNTGDNSLISDDLDRTWRIRDLLHRRLALELSNEYIAQQTFIPAGRAFFTSIGRLVAGIEQAGSLDPVTIRFAKLFASIRDRNSYRFAAQRNSEDSGLQEKRDAIMDRLFNGQIKFENDTEFVQARDGRKIPFASLSSGQQELLPMWVLMDYYAQIDLWRGGNIRSRQRRTRNLIYIEEPEAHLFPSAQSLLMEFLIGSTELATNSRSLILTTHSPYIMSKLNVFLKAGQLARRKKKNQEINEIVPRECWLNDAQLSVFAIEEGELRNLLGDDGLIDGTYLDQISEDIANEFSKLLKIESEL